MSSGVAAKSKLAVLFAGRNTALQRLVLRNAVFYPRVATIHGGPPTVTFNFDGTVESFAAVRSKVGEELELKVLGVQKPVSELLEALSQDFGFFHLHSVDRVVIWHYGRQVVCVDNIKKDSGRALVVELNEVNTATQALLGRAKARLTEAAAAGATFLIIASAVWNTERSKRELASKLDRLLDAVGVHEDSEGSGGI